MLAAVTALLEGGFVPKRTVVIALTSEGSSKQSVKHLGRLRGRETFAAVLVDTGANFLSEEDEVETAGCSERTAAEKYLSGVIKHVSTLQFGDDEDYNYVAARRKSGLWSRLSEDVWEIGQARGDVEEAINAKAESHDDRVQAHMKNVMFYYELIGVFDQAVLEWYI